MIEENEMDEKRILFEKIRELHRSNEDEIPKKNQENIISSDANNMIEIKKGSLITVDGKLCVVWDIKSVNIQRDFISIIEIPDEKDPDQTSKKHYRQLGKRRGVADIDLWPVDDSLYTLEEQMQIVGEFYKDREKEE